MSKKIVKKKVNLVRDAWKKVRKFSMTGEAKQENYIMDIWRLMNGRRESETPKLDHLIKIIPGDLVIATRLGVINSIQKYSINCLIKAKSEEGLHVEVNFSLSVSKAMTMTQFLNGADIENGEDPIVIDENGEQVEFLGANKLMENYLHTVAGDDFEIYEQHYTTFCYSSFVSREAYNDFKMRKAFLSTQVKVAA